MEHGERLTERRTFGPAVSTCDEVRGRSETYLRRRRDKERLALHLTAFAALTALTAWWVVPAHTFTGGVVYIVSPGRGIHVGDVPAVGFALLALASGWCALRAFDRLAS